MLDCEQTAHGESAMEQEILRIFEAHLAEYLDDLRNIVDQESPSDDLTSLVSLQRWLRGYLERVGLTVESLGDGDILHATARGGLGGRIVLIGHVDTVFPLGECRRRPFRVDGNRAYGPGAADMKGGVLLMAYALRALTESATPFGTVELVINADEEIGSPRAHPVIA
ncbi:peptidase M20, partial [mine drainage metagenome]